LEFTGGQIIGYCTHNNIKYLLWVKKGLLKKTNLDSYKKVLKTSHSTFVENISWSLRLTKVEYHLGIQSSGTVSDSIEDLGTLNEKIAKLRAFLNSIKPEIQIFL